MVALIVGVLVALFTLCISIAAMKGGKSKISLVLLYLSLSSLTVGLFSYGPYEDYDFARKSELLRKETEQEAYRARSMIDVLGGSEKYLDYLRVTELQKQRMD